ncbi:hypothetical protein BGZ54_004032 [Gamsiella multidivaricata]|nr:hypothetical protein BGZ54_004032 [Gamsiella multidivaricata]
MSGKSMVGDRRASGTRDRLGNGLDLPAFELDATEDVEMGRRDAETGAPDVGVEPFWPGDTMTGNSGGRGWD